MNASLLATSLALSTVAALATSSVSAQADGDTLTPFHVATMEAVDSAAISPDGRHVAYVRMVPRTPRDEEDGGARRQLHVLDCDTGESHAYVTADSGVSRVRWMPDSQGIAFLAKREGDEQRSLYVIPLRGGEARRAAGFDDRGISAYEIAPDGERVALVATVPEGEEREKQEKKGFKAEIYEEDWRPGEAWIAELFDDEAEPTGLEVDGHVSGVRWSKGGEQLAITVAPTSLVDDSYMLQDIWILDADAGSVTARIEAPGKQGGYAWKPDGSGLSIIGAFDVNDGSAARLQWAATSGAASPMPAPMLGERERDEHQTHWLSDDRLLVRGSQGAWSTLDVYRVEGGKAVERTSLLPLEGPVWSSVSVSRDGERAALVGSTPNHPDEVYTLDLDSGELVRRTSSNEWLDSLRLAKQEVIRYPARDGLEVEGLLVHPLDGQTPAPLLVVVHGGPEAHLSNGWVTRYAYPGQVAAARGYAVFYPNYRGSTGRGLAYLKRSQGDPAGKEFDDIVDGVDHLIERGIADAERVGVTGGSYGGYATAWCSTYYSDRFAAGVMAVGISNKLSKVGTTDIANEEFHVHALKRPWDDWQGFLEASPIYYADRGKTPLLILHGKDDTRVDPGQSREMYRHLKLRGEAPVRLVHYPGEGHGNRKAGARFDYNLRMLRWFDHYLMGDGGDPPDHDVDYDEHLPGKEEETGEEQGP
jgi:dipeptidyl aminopeptidase/acylaminoacyl peptidase